MAAANSPSGAFADRASPSSVPLHVVRASEFERFEKTLEQAAVAWLEKTRFSKKPGSVALVPGGDGPFALVVVSDTPLAWDYGALPTKLPRGTYRLSEEPERPVADALALGWALGAYRFERYKKEKPEPARLVWPQKANREMTLALAEGVYLARDLINTPASDMGPAELRDTARSLARRHGAQITSIEGDRLLRQNYPMIHAVGRASSRAPLLVDLVWGEPKHPRVTLVGKGVCFDTGGLDLKPPQFMKLMKKDMGGAALLLGLAHVIMSRKLPVRLRLLVPAVENSVSGDAMRPLDVLPSRKGITVEVGDTDAEGRLILADALTEGDSESPDLLIDAATLTGAARVALGTQIPAVFATSTESFRALEDAAEAVGESVWRLPLHKPYRSRLESNVADLSNIGSDSYGGAITAALFLQEFVSEGRDWVHIDTMGYNLEARPGRPHGGEAIGLLALDRWLAARYPKTSEDSDSSRHATKAKKKGASAQGGSGRTKRGSPGAGRKTSAQKRSRAPRKK